MAVLRKIALGLLLMAAAGVLAMAGWELWNYREWSTLPLNEPGVSTGDRARSLEDHVDLLTRRVGDMQLLVLILLGTSGLYAIVFVASSYFSATSFARQADQTIANMQDQIGFAMGDLRELQEQTEQKLKEMTAAAPVASPPIQERAVQERAIQEPAAKEPVTQEPAPRADDTHWESRIAEIRARVASWQSSEPPEYARIELIEDEARAIGLELASAAHDHAALAEIYLGFGRIYAGSDSARSRFYLERALRLAAPESAAASQIHYALACRYAASHQFPQAIRELSAAFEHQFRTLEERLAGDIEEGGQLYELASTPPFDKTVNDLLLNMSIGIG
jgi:hypothetical protein